MCHQLRMPPALSAAELNDITAKIIGAAIEVHRTLGPGLLEAAYHACLCYELHQARLRFERKTRIPLNYKGVRISCAYEPDIIVEDVVIVEVKAVETLARIHKCQLFTYLAISDRRVGLILNFGAETMKGGIERVVNRFPEHDIQ